MLRQRATRRRSLRNDRDQLERWVDYARQHDALILFDAAYEAYISDPKIPHSIFEIDGAHECAIELRSFSKIGFCGASRATNQSRSCCCSRGDSFSMADSISAIVLIG